jgi:hypothetical protein
VKRDTTHKNTKAPLDASKEVGLEVNAEKTKCMLISHCRKAGQRHNIKTANRSFEGVALTSFQNRIYIIIVTYQVSLVT